MKFPVYGENGGMHNPYIACASPIYMGYTDKGVSFNRACFNGLGTAGKGIDFIYFVNPKAANSINIPIEDTKLYLDLCAKAGIGKVHKIESYEDYVQQLDFCKVKDPNTKETWDDIVAKHITPFLFKADDFISGYAQMALGIIMRYADETSAPRIVSNTVKLYREYGDQFTPIQYIVFAHQMGELVKPYNGGGHDFLMQGFINPPKQFPEETFRTAVQNGMDQYYKVIPKSVGFTGNIGGYATSESVNFLNQFTLPEIKEKWDAVLDPEKVVLEAPKLNKAQLVLQ